MSRKWSFLVPLLLISLLQFGCASPQANTNPTAAPAQQNSANPGVFRIAAGSEIKVIEPVIDQYFQSKGLKKDVDWTIEYMGSVDLSHKLNNKDPKAIGYDAVWPANSLWVELGDTGKNVKDKQSIMRSPVVFGVKKSVAKKLGWVGKPVSTRDILAASEAGKINYVMTSATQSNSGTSSYLAFLYAFNNQKMITSETLADPQTAGNVKRLLRGVNRTSASSGWLNEFFVKNYASYDAEFNYESLIIAANQGKAGGNGPVSDPIYAIYPSDGVSIADCPLGYVDGGDTKKREVFDGLQAYLLDNKVQQRIQNEGWRTGIGVNITDANKSVFNPNWGIDTEMILNTVKLPKADVIRQSLSLYQTAFRKPSYTVYVLDYSPSMEEMIGDKTGRQQLNEAMDLLLDPAKASEQYIQTGPQDKSVFVAFAGEVIGERTVVGNDPQELTRVRTWLKDLPAEQSTAIFTGVDRAYEIIKKEPKIEDYFPAIILMTDGEANAGISFEELQARQAKNNKQIPVFGILFGTAMQDQLVPLADAPFSKGRLFDGRKDLTTAFKDAKGYN